MRMKGRGAREIVGVLTPVRFGALALLLRASLVS
jgi:hypothetical protein